MKRNRKSLHLVVLLCLVVISLSSCVNKTDGYIDVRGKDYAGSVSCAQCHETIYGSALQSAHYNASSPASKDNIKGDFSTGKNTFTYNHGEKVVMEERNDSLYQVHYKMGKEMKAYRFDLTFGIRNAQTWLYWENGNTYELPISYYTSVHDWATSPGFSSKEPEFNRLIGKDCFECHSSNISSKQNSGGDYFNPAKVSEVFEKKSLVYGIDCERCHGPAANHVNYHLKYPEKKLAKYIVDIGSLNKQQKLDMCAVCHSGNDKLKLKSRFNFKPGNSLSDFFMEITKQNTTSGPDVHGNQYGLLSKSKCFLESKTMDCVSCHDPHKNSNESLASYSKICMTCHSDFDKNFCTMKPLEGKSLKENCIDCHMPRQSSKIIGFQLSGKSQSSSYMLRSHLIGIYPIETKEKENMIGNHIKK